MYFDNKFFIRKYDSWIKVQVAFYDFIFQNALKVHSKCFNIKCITDFADGKDFYEESVKIIGKKWKGFSYAWNDFIKNEIEKEGVKIN